MTFVVVGFHPQTNVLIHESPEVFIDLGLIILVLSSLFTCLFRRLVGVIGALLADEFGT